MRPVCLLLIYIVSVFVGAALVAPWIYQLAQAAASSHPTFQFLSQYPFHRFVNRSLLFLALAGLWPFLRCLGIRSWEDLGFTRPALHWKNAVTGFFVGFCSLATLAVVAIFFGARRLDFHHSGTALFGALLAATGAAIAVAVLEECLFRGALFGALRKTNSWPVALAISSIIYALVHFFGKPESPEIIRWTSGFATLGSMFAGFAELATLLPKFFNLFIVGAILAFAFQRTGSLYFPIGLHAGWIFWLRSYGVLTNRAPERIPWLWGSAKIIDGWLATAVLLLVFGFLLNRYQPQKRVIDVA
jgi:membrane protease YdiL (CAAX protease family)